MSNTTNVQIGEKIKRLRSFRGLTCAELAERIGCTRPYLSAVENGRYPASTKILRKLNQALNVTVDYFTMPGEPGIEETTSYYTKERLKEETGQQLVGAAAPASLRAGDPTTTRRIPVVKLRSTGRPTIEFEDFPTGTETDYTDCPTDVNDANAFALRMDNDAMIPVIPQGATMVVAPNLTLKDGHPVIAKLATGEIFCRSYQAKGGQVILAPYNHNHPIQIFEASGVDWVYPVVKVVIDLYNSPAPMR